MIFSEKDVREKLDKLSDDIVKELKEYLDDCAFKELKDIATLIYGEQDMCVRNLSKLMAECGE